MDAQTDYLETINGAFAGLDDTERLDRATEAARSIRVMVDTIRAGEMDAPAALIARLSGAVVAFEAITAGRERQSMGSGERDV